MRLKDLKIKTFMQALTSLKNNTGELLQIETFLRTCTERKWNISLTCITFALILLQAMTKG